MFLKKISGSRKRWMRTAVGICFFATIFFWLVPLGGAIRGILLLYCLAAFGAYRGVWAAAGPLPMNTILFHLGFSFLIPITFWFGAKPAVVSLWRRIVPPFWQSIQFVLMVLLVYGWGFAQFPMDFNRTATEWDESKSTLALRYLSQLADVDQAMKKLPSLPAAMRPKEKALLEAKRSEIMEKQKLLLRRANPPFEEKFMCDAKIGQMKEAPNPPADLAKEFDKAFAEQYVDGLVTSAGCGFTPCVTDAWIKTPRMKAVAHSETIINVCFLLILIGLGLSKVLSRPAPEPA